MAQVRGGTATPLEPGLVNQVASGQSGFGLVRQGIKQMMAGWFSPGVPLAPVAPKEVAGRAFDFPVGTNFSYQPKSEATEQDGLSFQQLRGLADSLDVLRLMIETRKDQLGRMRWTIKPMGEDKPSGEKPPPRVQQALDAMKRPDGVTIFHDWVRRVLEDLLVLDAPAIYVPRNLGGKPMGFETIDGSTIKVLIDEDGRTPRAPLPAYQQVLKGVPAADLSTDDLIYRPRNRRTHRLYGYSPVEQVAFTVNIALRRQAHLLEYYTEGNIPDAIATVPEDWQADQIKHFQVWWDSLLSGNTAERRRLKFIPHGVSFIETKKGAETDKFEEYVARVVAFAFSVSPQALVSQVNRATAQTAQEAALQEGLAPLMSWVKDLCDDMLVRLGFDDLEFDWLQEEEIDPLLQAQVELTNAQRDQVLVAAGILEVDEIREQRGLKPLPEPLKPDPLPLVGMPPPAAGEAPASPLPKPAPGGDPKPAPAAPPAAGQDAAAALPSDAAASVKIAKAASIPDRESPAALKAKKKIQTIFKKWLRAQVGKLAAQISAGIGKVAKGDAEDRVARILEDLGFKDSDTVRKGVEAILRELYEDGGADALKVAGKDNATDQMLSQVHEKAVDWAKDHAADLIEGIEKTTKELIRADVIEALNEGWSTGDLADALADNYGFSDGRAETIARTETATAQIQGTLAGYNEAGIQKVEWVVGAGCCDECDALNGQEADIDGGFSDGPPPLHPNCRCDLLPVLNDPTETTEEDS